MSDPQVYLWLGNTCFFYFAVLSVDGAGYLAGAWLAFKLATRWQSARWAKPTELEVRAGYRAFQVGTVGNLLVGVAKEPVRRRQPRCCPQCL